jgi:hypothetical protein
LKKIVVIFINLLWLIVFLAGNAKNQNLLGVEENGGILNIASHLSKYSGSAVLEANSRVFLSETESGIAFWRSGDLTIPEYSDWDGTTFSTPQNAIDIGIYRVLAGATSKTRNETIIVGVDKDKNITGLKRSGEIWQALPFNSLALVSSSEYWSVDVKYEQLSGDAIIVWDNGNDDTLGLSFRIWDGISWSSEDTIPLPLSGEPRNIHLEANPNFDEMGLVITNENNQDYALIWNGSSWGNDQVLDNSGGGDETDAYIAYEQSNGRALAVYSNDNSVALYRIWDGANWSLSGFIPKPSGVSDKVRWIRLGPQYNSNNIAMGVLTSGKEVWLSIWNGAEWESGILATSTANGITYPNFDVCFESQSGSAMAVYGVEDNVLYRIWTNGIGWSAENTVFGLSAKPNSMILEEAIQSNQLIIAVQDDGKKLNMAVWNDSIWGSPFEIETNTGENRLQPFIYLWNHFDSTNHAPILSGIGPKTIQEGQTLNFSISASDIDGTTPNFIAINLPANVTFMDNSDGTGTFIFNPSYSQQGTYNILFITSDGALSDSESVSITVTPAPISYIEVSPATTNVPELMSLQFIALSYDAGSLFVEDVTDSVLWTTTDADGSITAGGLYTAGSQSSPPTYYVKATYQGAISDSSAITIVVEVDSSVIQIQSITLGNGIIIPGDNSTPILAFGLDNLFSTNKYLKEITTHNVSLSAGSAIQALSNIDSIMLYLDMDYDSSYSMADSLIDTKIFDSNNIIFSFDSLIIPAHGNQIFIITAKANLFPHDGDSIDIYLMPGSGLLIHDGTPVVGSGVINSYGYGIIDGMISDQLEIYSTGLTAISPGDSVYHLLTIDIPANGYADDTLNIVNIFNYGTATKDDFDSVLLFADDGNGNWGGPQEEIFLGSMPFTGNRYSRSGLTTSLHVSDIHTRFFIGVRLAQYPVNGNTIQFGIPLNGIEVISGNDGPWDNILLSSQVCTIAVAEELHAAAYPLSSGDIIPGAISPPLLAMTLTNEYKSHIEIDSLRIQLNFTDPDGADMSELISQIDSVILYEDHDGNPALFTDADIIISNVTAIDTIMAIPAFGISIEGAGGQLQLFAAAAINSSMAKDHNSLDMKILSPTHIYTTPETYPDGAFPLQSAENFVISAFAMNAIEVNAVPSAWLHSAQTNKLLMDFIIPNNGYSSDTLESLEIDITGTIDHNYALSYIHLYHDLTNNGLSYDDRLLGNFTRSGAKGTITDLALPAPMGGQRLLITVDIATTSFDGGTLNLHLPPGGIHYRSGMDGPDDSGFSNPYSHLVIPSNRITAISVPMQNTFISSGDKNKPVLTFALYNGYINSVKYLSGIAISNASLSQSSIDYADYELGQISLLVDTNGNRILDNDLLLGVGHFVDGRLNIGGLNIGLLPESLAYFFVAADFENDLIDSDTLSVSITGSADINFSEFVSINGDMPISSGYNIVNGSVGTQYLSYPLLSRSLRPGDSDITLFAFNPAYNGNLADTLLSLSLENTGNADINDISSLELWIDSDRNNSFDPTDSLIGQFSYSSYSWTLTDISLEIEHPSPLLLVLADISSDARSKMTIQLELPVNGCEYISANDGPIDQPIGATAEFVISGSAIQIQSVPPAEYYSIGQAIPISFTAKNLLVQRLDSVYGIAVIVVGSSLVRFDSGNISPLAIDGGDSAIYTFNYTALSDGNVSWQLMAASDATGDTSAIIQTNTVQIQKPASSVAVELLNSMPTSVTRGQMNIFPLNLSIAHTSGDSQTASIRLDTLYLHIENTAGTMLNFGDVISRLVLAEGYTFLNVMDNLPESNTIAMPFAEPIHILPEETHQLTILLDISANAIAGDFVLSFESPNSIPAMDNNTHQKLIVTSSSPFPLKTAPCRIDDPASYLAISDLSRFDGRANYGQSDVELMRIGLRHPGSIGYAQIQLTELKISAMSELGLKIPLSSVLSSLSVIHHGSILGKATTELSEIILNIPFTSVLTINPGITDSIAVIASINDNAVYSAFMLSIEDSTSFVARDVSSGAIIDAKTDEQYLPSGSIFPMESEIVNLFAPADDLEVCPSAISPASIISGSDNIALVEFSFNYEASAINAPIVVNNVYLSVIDSLNRPLDPGQLFDRIGYSINDSATIYEPFFHHVGGRIEFQFGESGINLNPGDALTIRLMADIEMDTPYDHFVMILENNALVPVDDVDSNNIPDLIFTGGCSDTLPFLSRPSRIFAPAGRPIISIYDNPTRVVYRGQNNIPLFEGEIQYNGTSLLGDLNLMGINGQLFKRESVSKNVWAAQNTFAKIRFFIDDIELAEDSIFSGDTISLTFVSNYSVKNGDKHKISIMADLSPNIQCGNYLLSFEDSTFIDIIDENLGTTMYPVINNISYPIALTEITVVENTLSSSFSNYPNPFMPSDGPTTIAYVLPTPAYINIDIYTVTGDLVARLVRNEYRSAGAYQDVNWGGTNDAGQGVLSGAYFCSISARFVDGKTESVRRKVAIVR